VTAQTTSRGPNEEATRTAARRRWPRAPADFSTGALLVGLWSLTAGVTALLVWDWPHQYAGLPWAGPAATSPPLYYEVDHRTGESALERDIVIDPANASADVIEAIVLRLAPEPHGSPLTTNVFTSEAAARRRRELIAAGVAPAGVVPEETDAPARAAGSPAWAEVNAAWVGIYTRDPANAVHELTICLNDPEHMHCSVRRY
jgi:hypothetical protein